MMRRPRRRQRCVPAKCPYNEENAMIIVSVDANACNGCGLCETMCPEVFSVRDDTAAVLVDEVPDEVEPSCIEAADCCPVEAITVREAEFSDV
jgi:ferredoxin